jgi:uncharacterized protein
MVIAILQFEVIIHGAESLKDKRRVVKSIKDRLHREHMVSVAEVARHDSLHVGRLALAAVCTDDKRAGGAGGRRAGELLDTITAKLRSMTAEAGGELGMVTRQVLHESELPEEERESESVEESAGESGPGEKSRKDAELARELYEHFERPD